MVVKVCQGRFGFHAEFSGRNDGKLHLRFLSCVWKRRPAQNFVGSIADFNFRCIEGIAISIDTLVGADRRRSPSAKRSLRAEIEPTRQCWLLLREGDA